MIIINNNNNNNNNNIILISIHFSSKDCNFLQLTKDILCEKFKLPN